MIVRCWGSRGSIPVSGAAYIRYGGDTTCLEIRTRNDAVIIVDAGTGIRRLGRRLAEEKNTDLNLIFTHAHMDHLMGFPFFEPLHFARTRIDLFGCPFAQESVERMIGPPMAPPYFPVGLSGVAADLTYHGLCEESFTIDTVRVDPVLLSHPNRGMGYRFTENGASVVFLTDNELTYRHPGGLAYDDYVAFVSGASLLIHDAQYTREEYEGKTKTWGHTVFADAVGLALDAGVPSLGLFHHDPDRTDDELDDLVARCRALVDERGGDGECFAVGTGWETAV